MTEPEDEATALSPLLGGLSQQARRPARRRARNRAGEILGLVGESGSGKSTIALALLQLLDHKGGRVRGEILFDGRDLLKLRPREMRRIRGREIALVLQSPLSSLNPVLRIGTQFAEAWRAHNPEPEPGNSAHWNCFTW